MADFNHFDASGNAAMVDVSGKTVTQRVAVAQGSVSMSADTLTKIRGGTMKKGDVLAVARLAGLMGAKRTSDLIPLCHPLPLDAVSVAFDVDEANGAVHITATCKVEGRTGVEMEALTAVSVTALTIYDMCKSVDRAMSISNIRLTHKSGGKSGIYEAN
jgi:cyclic pyranopterin monophosphate synthase